MSAIWRAKSTIVAYITGLLAFLAGFAVEALDDVLSVGKAALYAGIEAAVAVIVAAVAGWIATRPEPHPMPPMAGEPPAPPQAADLDIVEPPSEP